MLTIKFTAKDMTINGTQAMSEGKQHKDLAFLLKRQLGMVG